MAQESLFCPEHGNFPTKDAFDRHVLRHHAGAPIVETITGSHSSPPPGVDPSMLPSDELRQMILKASEQPKAKPEPVPQPVQSPTTPEKPKEAQPLRLEYIYTGECPTCLQKPSTLMLDMSTKTQKILFAIAYCNFCKKKVMEQKVSPLKRGDKTA